MLRLLDVKQGSPEWHAARRGIPTASGFDKIITAAKAEYSTQAIGYISELIDELVRPGEREEYGGNVHTERGKQLEPQARRYFELLTGKRTQQVGFVLRADGLVGCSPDSLILDDAGTYEAGLEIKCPDGPTHVRYMLKGTLPDEYKQQVHGSMVVTKLDRWWFLSYCPGYQTFLTLVERDAYTEKCAEAIDKFLVSYAVARTKIFQSIQLGKAA